MGGRKTISKIGDKQSDQSWETLKMADLRVTCLQLVV